MKTCDKTNPKGTKHKGAKLSNKTVYNMAF